MKKSYHSKIVPADEAAITRRISFALGVCSVAAMLAPSRETRRALANGRQRSQRGERRVPREQDRAVARGIGARGIEQGYPGPGGSRAAAGQPRRQRVAGRGDIVGSAPRRGGGKDVRGGLPHRASLRAAANARDPALPVERQRERQRAAATAR